VDEGDGGVVDKKSEKLAAAYIYIGIATVSIGAGGAYGWPLGAIVAGTCIATLGVLYLITKE
jgi:hypothetical protein